MKRITDEKIIEDATKAFQNEIIKRPSVGYGIHTAGLKSALISIRNSYPNIIHLQIKHENGRQILMVFEA